jgi:hypothetical protein
VTFCARAVAAAPETSSAAAAIEKILLIEQKN